MSDHVSHLVDDCVHGLLPPERQRQVETHCAACDDCGRALTQARQRLELLQALPPAEPSSTLVDDTLDAVEHDRVSWARSGRRLLLGAVAALAACVALLVGAQMYFGSLKASDVDLIVMGQGEWLSSSRASLRVRVVDGRGQTALAGVPVVVELLGGETVELARAETDEWGNAAPQFEVPEGVVGQARLRVRALTARGTETFVRPVTIKRSSRLMLSSDKPVYQPGQTILMRSLGLRRPDLKPVADQPAVFTLTDPKGNVLFKHRATTSRFGIASAECPLAVEIAEGIYSVACQVGDTQSKLAVEIKRYVLPKYKLDLTLDRPYYAPGEAAMLTIQADYFFGKPVAGEAKVSLPGETTQTVRLDEKGTAKVRHVLPPGFVRDAGGEATARFVVEVTDSAGQKQARAVERVVTTEPIRLRVLPEAGTLVRGVSNNLYFLAQRADGRPVAKATIELIGAGVPAQVTTDETGTAVAAVEPTGNDLGITMRLLGADGMPIARHHVNLTCGEWPSDFLVRPDRATYRAGESMTLTALGGGVEPVFVDLIRDGQTMRSEVIEMGDKKGGGGDLTFDLPAELTGTVRLVAYRFVNGLPMKKERTLYVAPAGGLKVQATLDAAEYRPGKEATLNVALTDEQGKPVAGAVSLVAVDEAVFAVQSQRPGMEQAFYTLEQELLKPVYAIYPWSPDDAEARRDRALFAATARGDGKPAGGVFPAGAHSLAGQTFPDKVRLLAALRGVRLEQVRMAWVGLIGLSLVVAYLSLYVFFPVRQVLLCSGVGVVVLCGLVLSFVAFTAASKNTFEFVGSVVATKQERAMAKDMAKGPPPAMPAGPRTQDTGPQGGEAAGEEAPRLRQFFPETLLWRPQLITDDAGRLPPQVVPLADNITTWRLSASAVSADGRLGAVERPVKVFQPFFVDLDLPPYLTRGDEVGIPVVVYSYLDAAQKVSLKLEAGDGFELLDDAAREIDLGKGEVRSTRYTIRVTKVGTHRLRVTARAGKVADAIEREVQVEPDGRRVEVAINGSLERPAEHTLRVPADAIEGSVKAFVKVYPSGFSQLVEGLDGIFRMPYGCFEQTSSTTYPNILALQYLKQTGKAVPAVEAKARQYLHLGYQRLVGFEIPGGGFDWFGRPPAHLTLTAYGLLEFEDMAKVHDVDPNLLSRTRRWLMAQRKADGSWEPVSRMLHEDPTAADATLARLSTTAYVAWAVFNGGNATQEARATREYLLTQPAAGIKDPHVLALVCLALHAIDPQAAELTAYLDALADLAKKEGDSKAYWQKPAGRRTMFYGHGQSADVETTALATLALLSAKRSPEVARPALAWLVSKKDAGGTWSTTQATVLALKALIAGQSSAEPAERSLVLKLGDHEQKLTIPADQGEVLKMVDLSAHVKPGDNRLSLTETTKTGVSYQVVFRNHVPEAKQPAKDDGPLGITLKYDRTSLAVDDVVRATATVTNNMRTEVPMVMLELPVPPGFEADADALAKEVDGKVIARVQVRPRSVLVYFVRLGLEDRQVLKYTLRAKMPVKAVAGPAQVYEYYDPAKRAQTPTTRFEVAARK